MLIRILGKGLPKHQDKGEYNQDEDVNIGSMLSDQYKKRIFDESDITENDRPPSEPSISMSGPSSSSPLFDPIRKGVINPNIGRESDNFDLAYQNDPKTAFRTDNSLFEYNYKNGSRKDIKNYMNFYNNKYGTDYTAPLFGGKFRKTLDKMSDVADFTKIGLGLGSAAVDVYNNKQTQKDWNKYFRDQNMNPGITGPTNRGDYDINNGMFRPNELGFKSKGMYAQDGGEQINDLDMNKIKIRIVSGPQEMAYGGQSGYGLDLGQRKIFYEMPKTKSEKVKNTIEEVPRDEANIEAELGETVYGDFDSDGGLEHLKIGGKRHVDGGTALNVPEGSFVYSDTKKMKIKDKDVLSHFGKSSSKAGGITPAELAKQYDVNKYKAIIEDPYADPISKTTAQLMVKNYEKKLGQLAILQESMKDFPGGVPQVAKQVIPEQAAIIEQSIMERKMAEENPQENPDEYTEQQEEEYEYGGNLEEYQGANKSSTVLSPKLIELQKKYPFLKPWITSQTKEGRTSPTGKETTYNTSSDDNLYTDVDYWMTAAQKEAKKINSIKDLQRYSYENLSRTNPEEIAKMWNDYGHTGKSNVEDVNNFGDDFMGARSIRVLGGRPKEETINERYICTPSGVTTIGPDHPANFTQGYGASSPVYSSYEEAVAACSKNPNTTQPPPPKNREYTPPNEFNRQPVPPVPFGYMQPDVFNMAATAAVAPKKFLPYIPDPAYTPGNVVFEDWRGKAAARQSQYNTSANTLGTYQPSTGLASNLAFLAGQNAEGLGQDIANVDARNVQTANVFSGQEQQRADQYNLLRANNAVDRWKGNVIANQQYDNALRKYIGDNSKSYANAWNNRMKLAMLNADNPLYNVSPRTGRVDFMPGVSRESVVYGNNQRGYTWDDYPSLVDYLTKRKVPQDKIHDAASKIIMGSVKNPNSVSSRYNFRNPAMDEDESSYF